MSAVAVAYVRFNEAGQRRGSRRFGIAILLVSLLGLPAAQASLYGSNLIQNPGGEASTGSMSGLDVVAAPSWTTTGSFTVAKYGSGSGVLTNTPGPAARGANYFAGGPTNAQSSARQDVPVSSLAADIDADSVTCQADGWLGGWLADNDNAQFITSFLDGSGQTISSMKLGPVYAIDRTNATEFVYRQTAMRLPFGTRTIRCTLLMSRTTGVYNDSYADNLSLVLTYAPPGAAPFGTNLLVNPAAELGAGSYDGLAVEPVPGWTTTGNFTVAQYGNGTGITSSSPGPADRGYNFFAGGSAASNASASQDLALFANAAAIDSGRVQCDLSGWFGGWYNQDDYAGLTATYLNAAGETLASQTIGSVHVSDRASVSGLFFRSGSGPVPAGTRKIRCSLLMTWVAGSYNDALADNLSLTLSFASPVLGIAISNDSAIISWSSEASDWTLQAATDLLLTGIWQNIAQPYSSTGGVFSKEVTGISATPRQFFRLVK